MNVKYSRQSSRKNEGRSQSLCTEEELGKMPSGVILTTAEPQAKRNKLDKTLSVAPPDGGWGWLVAFGGCCNHGLAAILVPTFSLIFAAFFERNKVSSITVAWIFNINQCLWNVGAFLGGPLCTSYGWRRVAFCGGLSLSISVILSGFVTKPELLFLTFSLFTGVGQGLCVVISFVIVANYFDKKKGIATGMVSAGNCLGQFLGPLLVRFLIENLGRQGTIFVLGAILLHTCVIALVFHPIEWHSSRKKLNEASPKLLDKNNTLPTNISKYQMNEKLEDGEITKSHLRLHRKFSLRQESLSNLSLNKISAIWEMSSSFYLNISSNMNIPSQISEVETNKNVGLLKLILKNLLLLKWHRVQIMTISVALAVSSYVNFLMMVPLALEEKGHSLEVISWCLAVAGVCNLIARILVTTSTDFLPFSTKYIFMMGSFGIFLSIIVFAFVSSPKMILLSMGLFGISVGICICLLSIISLELMGLELLPSLLGLNGLLIAAFFLILGPIIGAIRDSTQSHFISLLSLSVAPFLSFSLWFLMPCATILDKKKESQQEVL